MNNELEKAIRFFKNMRDDNKVVLNSGFGMKKGENNPKEEKDDAGKDEIEN